MKKSKPNTNVPLDKDNPRVVGENARKIVYTANTKSAGQKQQKQKK